MRFTFFEPGDGYRIETCQYYEVDQVDQVDRFGYGVGSAYYLEVEIVRVMDKGFEAMQYQSRALIDRNMLENRRRRQSEVIQLLSPSVADNPGYNV